MRDAEDKTPYTKKELESFGVIFLVAILEEWDLLQKFKTFAIDLILAEQEKEKDAV